MSLEGKISGIHFLNEDRSNKPFIPVDQWEPQSIDEVFVNCVPGAFLAPMYAIGTSYNPSADWGKDFNKFILSVKKGYNTPILRNHLFIYTNYFCNFYDHDNEYLMILFNLKLRIDRSSTQMYPPESFLSDMERYIIHGGLAAKIDKMVEDNYCQDLDYKNTKNELLQYNNDHAKYLHKVSMMMVLSIPLLTQYSYMHDVDDFQTFLLNFYDKILHMRMEYNIYEKMFETAFSFSNSNERNNSTLWSYQAIRGQDTVTHSEDSIVNIILNIIPKYTFDKNIISFNYASVKESLKYKVTDIQYEYQFIPSSSSKRDNDSVSDFDRFESILIKQNEALYLQNKINSDSVMRNIENMYGPFDPAEIDLYTRNLMYDENGDPTINRFQKQLLFLMFYKYFKDTQSILNINRLEYVKLVIAAKKILTLKNMVILPYIISAKVDKLVQRKNINKKERSIVEASPSYPLILNKYKNESIVNNIFSIIATIMSSEFTIIDMNPNINGKKLDIDLIGSLIEEIETFILMC